MNATEIVRPGIQGKAKKSAQGANALRTTVKDVHCIGRVALLEQIQQVAEAQLCARIRGRNSQLREGI
jgi:hypothetical protein